MAKPQSPRISVIERRLQSPSVFRSPSQPIPLKAPKHWTLRWVNVAISPNHLWDMIHQKGWEYCEPGDLACALDEISAVERDGRIVQGIRGEEVLMKMRTVDYEALQHKKSAENLRQTFGAAQMKQTIVERAATELPQGDRAASFLEDHVQQITVTDSRVPDEAS